MTSCGPGPERKYRSSVPPRMRYWTRETGEDGGVKSRMSEPAALREGQSGYEERWEGGLNLNRNTPCDRDLPVFLS